MKLESSTDKIEAIFEITRELDSLDGKAWGTLINNAEVKRQKEIKEENFDAIVKSQVILNMVLPLVKLTRLTLASEEVTPFMRTVIVMPLIRELLSLLTPIESSGVLSSLMYSIFDESKPSTPMGVIVMPQMNPVTASEDESKTIV